MNRRWHSVPTGPVVYRCFDADGRLLYIGSSRNMPARLGSHISNTAWWSEVDRLSYELHATLAEARAAEWAAITSETTVYNRRGTDRDRSFRRVSV